MKRPLLIAGTISLALIGGVAFASSQPQIISTGGNIVQPAGLDAPRNKPVEAVQAAQDAPEATENVKTPDVAPASQSPASAPQSEPQAPEAPAVPPAPAPTVVNTIGSGINGNARAGIDTFTCTYVFSDGSRVSRVTQYTFVESSTAAALCPEFE